MGKFNNIFLPIYLLEHKSTQEYSRLYSEQFLNRGDIVIFNMPIYQKVFGVKRCVYIPGDNICIGDSGRNTLPHNNYCVNIFKDSLSNIERGIVAHYKLEEKDSLLRFSHNYYYLLGDNKEVSNDSRVWGAVQGDHIVGCVKFILFSKEYNGKIRLNRFLSTVK